MRTKEDNKRYYIHGMLKKAGFKMDVSDRIIFIEHKDRDSEKLARYKEFLVAQNYKLQLLMNI